MIIVNDKHDARKYIEEQRKDAIKKLTSVPDAEKDFYRGTLYGFTIVLNMFDDWDKQGRRE